MSNVQELVDSLYKLGTQALHDGWFGAVFEYRDAMALGNLFGDAAGKIEELAGRVAELETEVEGLRESAAAKQRVFAEWAEAIDNGKHLSAEVNFTEWYMYTTTDYYGNLYYEVYADRGSDEPAKLHETDMGRMFEYMWNITPNWKVK